MNHGQHGRKGGQQQSRAAYERTPGKNHNSHGAWNTLGKENKCSEQSMEAKEEDNEHPRHPAKKQSKKCKIKKGVPGVPQKRVAPFRVLAGFLSVKHE